MAENKLLGVVLKSNVYKDRDLVVTLFSKVGIQRYYAKGVRTKSSKRSGIFEPLNLIDTTAHGNSAMQLLGQTKLVDKLQAVKSSETYYAEAFFLAELMLKLIPESEPHIDIFVKLASLKELKSRGKLSVKLVSAYLFLFILQVQGYLADLTYTVDTNTKITADSAIRISTDQPGYLTSNNEIDPALLLCLKVQNYWLNCTNISEAVKVIPSEETLGLIWKSQLIWLHSIIGESLTSEKLLR